MILDTIGSKSGKVCQKLISTFIAVALITSVLLGFPGLTSPAYAGPGWTRTTGWVTRFNVSNLEKSLNWYLDKLHMDLDYDNLAFPYYAQVYYPEYPGTQIGLSASNPVQSGQATATIVVDDIAGARDYILSNGVQVGELCNAGNGRTVLAFFCDPDGNNLALRQNYYQNNFPQCGPPICNNCN
ncbi:MAG: VOC family protein [Calothrix sp. MO_167.B42]|nr:VOC family protein [Calothrix sp. MO_167.B42]